VEADETRLKGLLEGGRYAVPYFQRSYSWGREQWNALWDDVLEVYQTGSVHFLGSVVLLQQKADEPLLIIDGQQRLVTLSLLLAAAGERHDDLLPTYRDQEAFSAVMADASELPFSPITEAYRVFKGRLDGVDAVKLKDAVLNRLSFVAITLGADDNPYRIFESLNAKGMPLTQGDLLRNYFFMRLPQEEHEAWYRDVWTPMQTLLGERSDDFMRDALVKEGGPVRGDEVYQGWRKRLDPLSAAEVGAVLRDLRRWADDYAAVLHPDRETDPEVRRRLERLGVWADTVVHSFRPFLLKAYGERAEGLGEMLAAVESYLVRRLFVSPGVSDDNQLFLSLYGPSLVDELSKPEHGWPDDDAFREAVVRCPLWFRSHPEQRRLILDALESGRTDRLDIEFVAPLLARPDWLGELGGGEELHWKLVGTLGNLAWGVRGRSLSLSPAERKKELSDLARHGLELNRGLAEVWSADAIEERSRALAERAITIWPGPHRG
jgi:uncharacterized protein DUF262